ncbi:hypothetical protein [Fimbriiglobus ruber]|uniref:Uncharacterized protein n=1 Tax=Fimbriiglobus ruber TaxID=1908690 RepID=A0A225DJU2_9BACT|nr:hypothetical protein [Fimbriiglobus ruber]OWK36407.1 hypothetical protein FRUB_08970 [Fimbriiglobus ruber]
MTGFGKLLTFLNVFVAVALLSWSVSSYTNRVDLLDSKNENETVEGQITIYKKEIDSLSKSIAGSQSAYGAKFRGLSDLELTRDFRRSKYNDRLYQARGADGAGRRIQAVFRVQIPAVGGAGDAAFTDLSKDGAVILGANNKPLEGLESLRKQFQDTVATIRLLRFGDPARKLTDAQKRDLSKTVGNNADYTELLNGLGVEDLRILHSDLSELVAANDALIGRQKTALTNLREEAAYLGSIKVNWVVQLQTLERRQAQLEARLQEFK